MAATIEPMQFKRDNMKVLAFSDLHRDVDAVQRIVAESQQADVIIGAGDFATCGLGAEDTLSVLKTLNMPVIMVSGNHDNTGALLELCDDWENGHLLHGTGIAIDGVEFFGLGDAVPERHDEDWNQSLTEDVAAEMLQACPVGAVLVTHTPPFGYCDLQRNGAHEGSVAICNSIKTRQPILNLCGHIHNSWNTTAMVGNTQVYNLGPTAHWFEV